MAGNDDASTSNSKDASPRPSPAQDTTPVAGARQGVPDGSESAPLANDNRALASDSNAAGSAPKQALIASSEGRSSLLERARAFLMSSRVVHEPVEAKRRFLAEKGLNEVEVESLMRELVRSN